MVLNREQWLEKYKDVLPKHKNHLPEALEAAYAEASQVGFMEGQRWWLGELDAVLRDLWLHDNTGEPEDVGYQHALENVAEHFGLGIAPD